MPTLLEIENWMRDALLAQPAPALLASVVGERIAARERIEVYRTHFRLSLAEGLARVFPATRLLLGETCFDALATRFVCTAPPRDPRLDLYGAGFPALLEARPELRDVAYVPEVARLEWALAAIAHAPDEPAAHVPARAATEGTRMPRASQPFTSAYPACAVRRAALAGDGAPAIAALLAAGGPEHTLLFRDADGDPCELRLEAAPFEAVRRLHAGHGVAGAVRAAQALDPAFDAHALIGFLSASGLLAGASIHPASQRDAA